MDEIPVTDAMEDVLRDWLETEVGVVPVDLKHIIRHLLWLGSLK